MQTLSKHLENRNYLDMILPTSVLTSGIPNGYVRTVGEGHNFVSGQQALLRSGTTTWFKYDVSFDVEGGTPLILDSRTGDYANFTIQDDLSSLLYFKILTNGIEDKILPDPVVI